ncbi:MAG: M61 family metallopeptidase, partial [Planctomycetes bacterium]|nr:M61 family metallopeptidase [Planctomycetota bacterium]
MTRSNTMAIKHTPLPPHPTRPTPKYAEDEVHAIYKVSTPEPWTHNIWVEIEVHRGDQEGDLVLVMPAWTPGSYKIREFAKNVSHFQAFDAKDKELDWDLDDKQSWRIKAGSRKVVKVKYRLYAFELSVRTPHCDDTHCFFQPTNALMFIQGQLETRSELIIEPFERWQVACPLPTLHGRPNHFVADSYDILADSPVEIGEHDIYSFEVSGKRHDIVIYGFGNHDPEQMVKDFRKIVLQNKRMWGDLPYENYMFILQLLPKMRGGLEHLNSQVSQWDSYNFDTREGYEDFLSLISHEFFHLWNV